MKALYCLVHEPAFGAMAGRLKGMVKRVLEPDEVQGLVAQLSANMPLDFRSKVQDGLQNIFHKVASLKGTVKRELFLDP